jgi:alpha-N-arabinofuranosidase
MEEKKNVAMNRREFLAASMAGAAVLQQGMKGYGAPAGDLQVEIDATKVGEPVNPMIFGGYMEPATTRVWAEMLGDRKFVRPITAGQQPTNPFSRMFGGEPWTLVGPEGTVVMDTVKPWVGKHSPRIKVDGSKPRGIQQGGLRLKSGKTFAGRVILKGDPTAKVVVRFAWGTGANDSQTITIPTLSSEYKKFPLKFTSGADTGEGRLEIVGTGSGIFHIGVTSLMPTDNVQGFHAGLIKHIKESNFGMAKWPGGNFVSTYYWRDGLGDLDKRPPRIMPDFNLVESNDMGLHEFMTFCRLIGAEPDLAINSGFGEAYDAAEEVEYMNGSIDTPMAKLRAAHGHPEPYKIRYWTIGNEMYGPWQYGHMSLNQYWLKHNDIVTAMRKVDPKIKVTSAGATICESAWCAAEQNQWGGNDMWRPPLLETLPYKIGSADDWDYWLLKNCADNIDMLSEHTYCYPDDAFNAEKQVYVDVSHDPLPMRARRDANRIGEAFEVFEKYMEMMPELKEKKFKFSFDEWGCRFLSAGEMDFFRRGGMVSPLNGALLLHELFRRSDRVALSCPTGGLFAVLVDETNEAVGYSADGLVMKLMATHFADALPLAVDGNSPQKPVSGTPYVDRPTNPVGSPTYPLDVVAAFTSDRKKFLLSVVNPTEDGQEFKPQINGVKLRSTGKLWQIAAPSVDAVNVAGKEPLIKINEISQGPLPDTVQVPPISVNVYEYEIG